MTTETASFFVTFAEIPWSAVGPILLGVSALLGAFTPILLFFVNRRAKKERSILVDELRAITTKEVLSYVRKIMLEMVETLDPDDYYTHEMCFPGIPKMFIPVIMGRRMPILENMMLCGISHSKSGTIFSMTCKGHGHIGRHFHEHCSEELLVKEGIVRDTLKGVTYKAGDTWMIPAGEEHAAIFEDCVVIITVLPPLPTAKERPVDLDAFDQLP